ncbi:MAG: type I pullulanase [Bacillota bacterium]
MLEMRKILVGFIAVLTMFIVTGVSVHAEDAETLVIHYYRFDEDYSQFDSVWLWNETEGTEGARYTFDDEDDYGAKVEIDVEEEGLDGEETGLLVRDDDWNKDVSEDRFIDMSEVDSNGEVHAYLVQGDKDIYYEEDDADTSHRLTNATFSSENRIEFESTKELDEDNVELLENDTVIDKEDYTIDGREGSFSIDQSVDLSADYVLKGDFGDDGTSEVDVRFDGFYNSDAFNEEYGYDGELGALYSESSTEFKLWAPISDDIQLNLYEEGHDASVEDDDGNTGSDEPYETYTLEEGDKGVWSVTVEEDLDGTYYTFDVQNGDTTHEDVVDPYAKATGVNGERGMVLDFDEHSPDGWSDDERPDTIENPTDASIYELHVRDFTTHESWNGEEDWRGKFLGLTERGTTHEGMSTGLDHIIDLGVTHVQILPFFDHGIIDETRHDDPDYEGIHDGIFNWGYMPENFNALEGSYATDPYNGEVRVKEFKEMVQTFHENDLRVNMDVVYNHTGKSADSNFDKILPGYYFRMNEEGEFSNGSGTGNETASEREMFRKYMVDSIKFWAEEYNIDGFRFDLMRLHDVETMEKITEELEEIDPSIMVYGEPWDAGGAALDEDVATDKDTLSDLPRVGAFNDNIRDAVKGSVFEAEETGFVQGNDNTVTDLMLGITGGLNINQNTSDGWTDSPSQSINYVTAHDNNTLHDKLRLSTDDDIDESVFARMHRQSNSIVLTSQGVPFLHAGVEIMRTKPCVEPDSGEDTCDEDELYDHNSYRSPDETNQIDWEWKSEHEETYDYYKDMIALRQNLPALRLSSKQEVRDNLTFGPYKAGQTSYLLNHEEGEYASTLVLHNNGAEARDFYLSGDTEWELIANTDEVASLDGDTFEPLETYEGRQVLTLEANDSFVLVSDDTIDEYESMPDEPESDSGNTGWIIAGSVAGVLVVGISGFFIYKRKF